MDEELAVAVERHGEQIKTLQQQIKDIKEVNREIKTMSETLITLTGELKHMNKSLVSHENRLAAIEAAPRLRLNLLINSALTALISGLIGYMLAQLI